MPNIDSVYKYIDEIRQAKNGAEARMPISKAFSEFYEKGKEADKLNDLTADDLLKYSDLWGSEGPLPLQGLVKNSKKAVSSGAVYAYIGDLESID